MDNDPATAKHSLEPAGLFATTHWSLVLRARDKSEAALETLFTQYREPLLAWLRMQGYGQMDAEDLLHGFLEGILRRDAFGQVSSDKGKFRTFLLRCLKYYICDERDKQNAAKRGGGKSTEPLEQTAEEGGGIKASSNDAAPDLEYDRAWAQSVLNNSFQKLQAESSRRNQSELYAALEPVMFSDDTALPYQAIATRLGMSEGAVKMAASRLRNRLGDLVQEEVMQTVDNPQDWLDEVRYLIELFGQR